MLLLLFPLTELVLSIVIQAALAALAAAWVVTNLELWGWLEWVIVAAPCLVLLLGALFVLTEPYTGVMAVAGGLLLCPAVWVAGSWLRDSPYGAMRWAYWGGAALLVTLGAVQLVRRRRETGG